MAELEKAEGGISVGTNGKVDDCEKPLVSVVIVVFNGKAYIENAIRSVISQSYDRKELVVVDGGSTDGTLDILRQYDQEIDVWTSEKDAGIYDAMNRAVKYANGEWVYFLGCDDKLVGWDDELANKLIKPNAIYYGNVEFSSNGEIYDRKFNSVKILKKNICQQAIFYPRSALTENEFSLKYKILSDYATNIALWFGGDYSFEFINKTIAIYNNEEGVSSTGADENFRQDRVHIVKKHASMSYVLIYLISVHYPMLLKRWLKRRF